MNMKFYLVAFTLTLASLANSQYNPYFQSLGALPGNSGFSYGYGISRDGSTVVGYTGTTGPNPDSFKWNATSGMTYLSHNSDIYNTRAHGVSSDGAVVAGECNTSSGGQAYIWTSATGMTTLGQLGGGVYSAGYALSPDGKTVVGEAASPQGTEAFKWTQAGGMIGLGDLPGGGFRSSANAVSDDGSVVVGYSESTDGTYSSNLAFRWTQATGMVSLGTFPGGYLQSYADGISGDGNTVVGTAKTTNLQIRPFKWTQSGGMVQISAYSGQANSASFDGSVIVGEAYDGTSNRAFIYDDTNGFKWLQDVLVSRGLGSQLSGWTLTSANSVTVNSYGVPIITGYGVDPNGKNKAFIAAVPEPGSALGILLGMGLVIRRRSKRKG